MKILAQAYQLLYEYSKEQEQLEIAYKEGIRQAIAKLAKRVQNGNE